MQSAAPPRSPSPDITSILSKTPRPRRRTSSFYSTASSTGSHSDSRSRQGTPGRIGDKLHIISQRLASTPIVRGDDDRYDNDLSISDLGTPIQGDDDVDPVLDSRREGSSTVMVAIRIPASIFIPFAVSFHLFYTLCDNSSSFFLRDLMVRNGFLSPNSKLLPGRTPSPEPETSRDSIFSIATSTSLTISFSLN
jgi:hypothetical protein